MLRRLIGEDIELDMALAADLPEVLADPAPLEQVIVNLAVNARDAMPDGGRLTIETTIAELDDVYADSHATVPPGPYVLLAVTDTGDGMDAATRTRVFEPFFTTKEQGKGTGLGLATVYGIVKQTGGHIWVYSEPGHGTTFKVYLPLAGVRSGGRRGAGPRRSAQGDRDHSAGRGRGVGARADRRRAAAAGLHVLEAEHGLEALKIVQSLEAPIHLLLTDVVMPHMNGRELAEQILDRAARHQGALHVRLHRSRGGAPRAQRRRARSCRSRSRQTPSPRRCAGCSTTFCPPTESAERARWQDPAGLQILPFNFRRARRSRFSGVCSGVVEAWKMRSMRRISISSGVGCGVVSVYSARASAFAM